MDAIYIPQLLRAPQQQETIQVQEFLPDLETLTPVQGVLQVMHQGNFLQVTAAVETIVTLTCDRCLQQYNYRLQTKPTELIWLEEPDPTPDSKGVEVEVPLESLVETLPPQGYFQPDDWLYQQLCLALPQRQLCDRDCQGIKVEVSGADQIDHRWAALEALKKTLGS